MLKSKSQKIAFQIDGSNFNLNVKQIEYINQLNWVSCQQL